MKNIKVKYSRAYKANLKESLLERHQELYGKKPWFEPFKVFRWALAPALVLILAFTLPFSPNPQNFLNEVYAAQVALIGQAREKIVHETLQFSGSQNKEERWTAPNGDYLVIQKSAVFSENIFLSLGSQQKAFSSEDGLLQPVLMDKELELKNLEKIKSFYYEDEEDAKEYARITMFLEDANVFESADFTLWLKENLGGDIVKDLGEKGGYHLFEVHEPKLKEKIAKEKDKKAAFKSLLYFNSETHLLERITYSDQSYTTISVEMIETEEYKNIFNPSLYSLSEAKYLQ